MNANDPKWDSMLLRDVQKHDRPEATVLRYTEYHNFGHAVEIYPDDGQPITFNWHLPRGTLSKRMSGLELALVLGPHLPAILPLLIDHPRCYREMAAMVNWMFTRPRILSDQVVSWMKSLVHTTEYDIVQLSIGDKTINSERPIISV